MSWERHIFFIFKNKNNRGGKVKKTLVGLMCILALSSAYGATSTSTKSTKAASSSAKKVMKEKREDLFESLEEKVFRAPDNQKARIAATDNAFDIGKKRMYYLQREEDEIRAMEANLGMEEQEHNFLNDKYDAVMNEFKDVKNETDVLTVENKKLKEYMARLTAMETKVNGGRPVK